MNLDVFFTPRSVAVIGASRTPGKVGHDVLDNLVSSGFNGDRLALGFGGSPVFALLGIALSPKRDQWPGDRVTGRHRE